MEQKRREIEGVIAAYFDAHKRAMVGPILSAYGHKAAQRKASESELLAELDRLLALMETAPLAGLADEVSGILAEIAQDGAREALAQVGMTGQSLDDMLTFADQRAVEWAGARSAELVGMRRLADGSLVANPNAEWAISESTRDMIRADVEAALREGWSNDRLAQVLSDNYGFSRERAEMIARTETAFADASSHQPAWRDAGVGLKQWLRSNEGYPCVPCELNAQAGAIPIDQAFPTGDMEEPQHPNCECVVIPVVED